ncbi:MAG: hypothetical protein JSW09_08910 [Pseudomonadota bacterium]|nr:MAG: hypothetical protein JSW09_08910 [Pseudomonadota bacterium]
MAIRPLAIVGQLVAYAAFMAVIGYFAAAPAYSPFPSDQAQIKLSFRHTGPPKVECRRLTPEEIAKLAPNMRRAVDCPRERLPIAVEVELDGKILYAATLPPTGIWKDGSSKIYETFAVLPGRHTLTARLRDSRRAEGFDHTRREEIELRPRQNFVIEFRGDRGGFIFE